MTIRDIAFQKRTTVIWFGQKAPAEEKSLLEKLEFSVDDDSPTKVLKDDAVLGSVAAAVFVQSETKPLSIVAELETYVERLLDYECLVFIVATKAGLSSVTNTLSQLNVTSIWPPPEGETGRELVVFDEHEQRTLSRGGVPPLPHVNVYRDSPAAAAIAQQILRYGPRNTPAADVPGVFEITGPKASSVTLNHRLMLRRSFHDCRELYLNNDEIDDGRSGVRVYMAHATLRQPYGLSCPLPFFVKVGPRKKILREWRNYEQHVREYVPFHLGPRLVRERCALGAHEGIIVGDFVEDSEGLDECSRNGRAATPIGTLFDRTLRGWHFQPATGLGPLYAELRKLIKGEVPAARLLTAMHLGAKRNPAELISELQRRPPEELLLGQIHGDLHAGNVRVRGSDAILIDFHSCRNGALLVDPAALEVSLAIRFPKDVGFNKDGWERIVRYLFSREALLRPPTVHDRTEPYAWLVSCVRQIRLHASAMQIQQGQYAWVLAVHLLQAASKDPNVSAEENYRRAMAYFLADSLVDMVRS
jgi:hypothetical protein